MWAPKGQRPIALGHHRYKWLYVTAFVQPISGETFWYISNGVSKPFFAALLALFAREAGAGRDRIIVLGLDSAGWHTAPNLACRMGSGPSTCPRTHPSFSRLSTSGPPSTSHSPTGTSPRLLISSTSWPSAVAFSITISSNPAQTSTGGPSQISRPNQPETVSGAAFQSDRLFVEAFEESAQDGSEIDQGIGP